MSAKKIRTFSGQVANMQMSNLKKVLWIILAMLVSSIAARYFIIYTNIFSSGVAGLSQGITYTISQGLNLNAQQTVAFNNIMYYVINGFFNIFIVWYAWKKFGKNFALWSALAFMTALSFGIFFQYTPGFNTAGFIPNYVPVYNANEATSSDSAATEMAITFGVTCIAATLGGLLSGTATGLVWKTGACTLGFDPMAKTLAREKNISAKKGLFIFSLINSFIWILVSNGMSGYIDSFSTFLETIFNARFLGTIIFLIVNAISFGWVYPATKKVLVEVNTTKAKTLSNALLETKFHRSHTISYVIGGYTRKERTLVRVIMMTEEIKDFLTLVNECDENAFAITYHISKTYGKNGY